MDSNKLFEISLDAIRRVVYGYFPSLKEKGLCDIDLCLAYDAVLRTQGLRIRFPRRPMGLAYRKSGVQVGTVKCRRLRASRSAVRFNYVWIATGR